MEQAPTFHIEAYQIIPQDRAGGRGTCDLEEEVEGLDSWEIDGRVAGESAEEKGEETVG